MSYKTEEIKEQEKWNTVNAIAYVRVQTMEQEEVKITNNYYIINYKMGIEQLEKVIKTIEI